MLHTFQNATTMFTSSLPLLVWFFKFWSHSILQSCSCGILSSISLPYIWANFSSFVINYHKGLQLLRYCLKPWGTCYTLMEMVTYSWGSFEIFIDCFTRFLLFGFELVELHKLQTRFRSAKGKLDMTIWENSILTDVYSIKSKMQIVLVLYKHVQFWLGS